MFKRPTGAELIGLFFAPTKVAHAIRGIEAAAKSAEGVGRHNRLKASARLADSALFQTLADQADDKADAHMSEADRAARVTLKLRELVA
jgi:hypothetical protein